VSLLSRLLSAVSVVGTAGCVAASATLWLRFRQTGAVGTAGEEPTGLSMIVPLKGIDRRTEEHLEALVAAPVPGAVEYIFAMETADDPAYRVCHRVQTHHPDKAIQLMVAGSAGRRMGKQHNLGAGVRAARYAVLGSMDADVRITGDTLAVGLSVLADRRVGVAYYLPLYRGSGPLGGTVVALYSNYYYALNMAGLALLWRDAPFIIGGLWLMPRTTLERIGGLEQFAGTVSDDAAIGRAVVRQGLRPALVPRTVAMPMEELDLSGGIRQLLKWMTILTLWHPVFWSAAAALTGVQGRSRAGTMRSLALCGAATTARLASVALLNRRVYGIAGRRWPLIAVAYELLGAPLLFGVGLFRSTIAWRGRRYRLGAHGTIQDVTDVPRRV